MHFIPTGLVRGGGGHPGNRKLYEAYSSLGRLFHILLVTGIYWSTIVCQVLGLQQGIKSLRSQGICIVVSRREEMYCGCCWLSAVEANTGHEGRQGGSSAVLGAELGWGLSEERL